MVRFEAGSTQRWPIRGTHGGTAKLNKHWLQERLSKPTPRKLNTSELFAFQNFPWGYNLSSNLQSRATPRSLHHSEIIYIKYMHLPTAGSGWSELDMNQDQYQFLESTFPSIHPCGLSPSRVNATCAPLIEINMSINSFQLYGWSADFTELWHFLIWWALSTLPGTAATFPSLHLSESGLDRTTSPYKWKKWSSHALRSEFCQSTDFWYNFFRL